tara:strand:+ start:413 stop:718 length:306 start_codon:yes stop_codon:yes gene_type:complete
MSLKDKVIFISGGSRGIGLAMVKKAAEDGAKIAIAAKTAEPHPKLPGTIYTAADEIVEAGGEALPVICDIRNEDMSETPLIKLLIILVELIFVLIMLQQFN